MGKRKILSIFYYLIVLLLSNFLPVQAQAWKCVIYGDTRSNDSAHRSVLRAIVNNTPDYKFIINVGDVVNDGDSKSLWDIWQQACNDILGGTGQDEVPPKYMSVPGNHDDVYNSSGLANWNTYLPGQKKLYGNNGLYFFFDYEDARFVLLDSDYSSQTGAQYTMLMQAIQNNPKKWLIVVWHHPIFDFGPKYYESDIHEKWGVPLYQNGCDIIFNGHAHYYVRTKKLNLNGQKNPPLDSLKGTVQIVTGNGAAPLYSVNPNEDGNGYMVEKYISQYGYTELTFDGDTLRMRHILADGTVFDQANYTPNPKPSSSRVSMDKKQFPSVFRLSQNYPNPFNAITTIKFFLSQPNHVRLDVYNVRSELVETLIDGKREAGIHRISFDADKSKAGALASGIYFYQLKIGTETTTKKMFLLR